VPVNSHQLKCCTVYFCCPHPANGSKLFTASAAHSQHLQTTGGSPKFSNDHDVVLLLLADQENLEILNNV